MKKEVRKFKIVELNGVLTQYYWKKKFWIFGYWVPYKNTFSNDDAYTRTYIKKIDDFIGALENK